jgi:hypothetical protein
MCLSISARVRAAEFAVIDGARAPDYRRGTARVERAPDGSGVRDRIADVNWHRDGRCETAEQGLSEDGNDRGRPDRVPQRRGAMSE